MTENQLVHTPFEWATGLSWKTKKQTSVALSSVEAEYMAMCQAAKEAVWLTGLLKDFSIDLRTPPIIFGDSEGALALAHNPAFHPRSKHIAIQYHFTRRLVQNGSAHRQVHSHKCNDSGRAHQIAPSS